MLEYPTSPYGPSLLELRQLKHEEIERRKKMRILQVRSQAKESARKVRMLYNVKKQQLSDLVAKKLQVVIHFIIAQIKLAKDDIKLLEAKKCEYINVMQLYGIGHKSAENWNNPVLETNQNLSVARKRAEDRFNMALNKLHEERLNEDLIQHETQKRIKEVRNVEKKRAALIASLPPSRSVLIKENSKPTLGMMPLIILVVYITVFHLFVVTMTLIVFVSYEPLVLVYDIEARNAIHTQNMSSKVLVNNIKVDEATAVGDKKAQNATISAYKEEERIQAVERENNIHAQEDLIKADMRGRQAMRKERIHQHYQALLNRLDEIRRNETLLRRSQLYSGTIENSHMPGGPWDETVINRRAEKIFEDELLHQLTNINHEDCADVIDEENIVDSNNNHIDKCNQVLDIDSEINNLPVKDVTSKSDHNLLDHQISLSNEPILELDLNDEFSFHDEEHLSTKEEEITPNEEIPAKYTDLGPGERPTLPDIRRCRILSGSINLTNPTHDVNSNNCTTSKPVHRNFNTPSQSIVSSKTSFEDKLTSDVFAESGDMQLRQRLLDEELEMIDKRINRLRFNSSLDPQENQSHSVRSSESFKEPNKTTRNTTPRNMYIIEGCIYKDNALLFSESIPTDQKISSCMAFANQNFDNNQSTVVKYCISKPITGVLAERARDLVRIQKAELLNCEKSKSFITESSQSFRSSSQSSIDAIDFQFSAHSSSTNNEMHENEDVSCFIPESDTNQMMNHSSITGSDKHNWDINDNKHLSKHSLQQMNVSVYESSTLSTSTPVVSYKPVQSLQSHCDVQDVSHFDEVIDVVAGDVVQDVDKMPVHDSSFEVVTSINDLSIMNSECYNHLHEPSNIQLLNGTDKRLETKIPTESLSDQPHKIPSQSTSLVDISSKNKLSSSTTTLSPQSSLNSPSSIGSKQTILLSSSDKPQSSGSCTSDTLKAELKALLTSSLLNSILSYNSSGLTTDTNDLKKLFSSQSFLLSSLSGVYRDLSLFTILLPTCSFVFFGVLQKFKQMKILLENEMNHPITSISSTSSLSNPSVSSLNQINSKITQLNKLSDHNASNQELDTKSIDRPLCDGHTEDIPVNNDHADKLPINDDVIKAVKQRILNKYLQTNKEWLINLSSSNRGKLSHTRSSTSSSSSSGVEFHYLSEATDTNEINWSENKSDSFLHSEQVSANKSSSFPETYDCVSFSPQTYTPLSNQSARFKPLPRLEEAISEESIHTIQVVSDFNNLSSNTPSSWTESRKSSEFGNLSQYSATNRTSGPGISLKNENENSPNHNVVNNGTCSHQSSEENDTIQQLLSNIPDTPIDESNKAEIIPCIGSKLSLLTTSSEKLDNARLLTEDCDQNVVECSLPHNSQHDNGATNEPSVIVNNEDSKDEIPVENSSILCLKLNSRPSSPAEGAVSKFSPRYHQIDDFNVSSSLPSVHVESLLDRCEKYQIYAETVHCASDSNLKPPSQTNEASVTDSLLSFQRHEEHCNMLSINLQTQKADDPKCQLPNVSSNNINSDNVSLAKDTLQDKPLTGKPTNNHSKFSITKHKTKDSMINHSNGLRTNHVVKGSGTRKPDPFVSNSSKQRTTHSKIVRNAVSTGQKSIKFKYPKVNIPSSSTNTITKTPSKQTSTTNSLAKRQTSVPVCTKNLTITSCSQQTKPFESYSCMKLNPFNQAKTLQMELTQWQQKRLRCHKVSDDKDTMSKITTIPSSISNDVNNDNTNIESVSDSDVINFGSKFIPDIIQDENKQQQTQNSNIMKFTSSSISNRNRSPVELTVDNVTQQLASCFVDIDASICSGENIDQSKLDFEAPNDANVQLISEIPPDTFSYLKKSSNFSVKTISSKASTSLSSSSKLHEQQHDSLISAQSRHQQAHANRQRVKEYDRILLETFCI
ncbi:Centrosomal protein [Schistosoma japonicum]|nr:Centrosomal protein [Schistosoma japonicum]